jgi:hypothetical protein
MIEPLIVGMLKADEYINTYAKGDIFVTSAPDGVKTPYIAVARERTIDEAGVVSVFDVTIYVFDAAVDKEPLFCIEERVIRLLNNIVMPDTYRYIKPRLWYERSEHIREPESTLSHVVLTFNCRAVINFK